MLMQLDSNMDSNTHKRKRVSTGYEINHDDFKRKKNKTAKDKQWWTTTEDDRLRRAVQNCGAKNWKLISEIANVGKSDVQCLQRWTQVLRPGLKKGTWSKDEDFKLTELVTLISANSKQVPWKKIEKQMGGRTAKQCRERWKLSLDPSINKAVWSKAEDDQLLSLQSKLGNSWSKIKDMLGTNRTENAVKLRFKCLKKREDKYKRNLEHLTLHEQNLSVNCAQLPVPILPQHSMGGGFWNLFMPYEMEKTEKVEANDLTLPLPESNMNLFDQGFEMFEVKQELCLGELNLDRFDSVKPTEFDEVLQMLSEDDASEVS